MNISNKNILYCSKPWKPIFVGLGAFAASTIVTSVLLKPFGKELKKAQEVEKDQFNKIETATNEAIKLSGVKNLEIIKFDDQKSQAILDIFKKEIECANPITNKIITESSANAMLKEIKEGENAYYCQSSNKIILPKNDLKLTIFHEIGHAKNRENKFVKKYMEYSTLITSFGFGLILSSGLIVNKIPKGTKITDFFGKSQFFIKNHAAKLTALSCMPMLLDEFFATRKANKLAQATLKDEKLVAQTKKANNIGFSSYIASIGLSALIIFLTIKARDKYVLKKMIS